MTEGHFHARGRFPFEVFYELTVDTITIYSVFHCSQDPEKWRKRLGY